MAITRDSRHKRRNTGGRRNVHKKKRKFETGRQPANTKLVIGGEKRVRQVRSRGGNIKFRALRLDSGNFSWGSQVFTHTARILDVVYNSSNNELVRTNTLVKGCIVHIDASAFKEYYQNRFHCKLEGRKGDVESDGRSASKHVLAKMAGRKKEAVSKKLLEQLAAGRILACISSRPGQSGRADGYILEAAELEFYTRQLQKKKSGKKA